MTAFHLIVRSTYAARRYSTDQERRDLLEIQGAYAELTSVPIRCSPQRAAYGYACA